MRSGVERRQHADASRRGDGGGSVGPVVNTGPWPVVATLSGEGRISVRNDFHLVGPWASELLAEGYLAVNWQATPEEVGAFIHPHPSLSEAIGETMLTFTGRSLHG